MANPVMKKAMRVANSVAVGLYRRSSGRIGGKIQGTRVLLLTVAGRKTGTPHTVAVSYFDHDGGYLLAGSAGGAKYDPQWVRNLAAAKKATIQIGGMSHDVDARLAEGAERDTLWRDVVVATAPFFGKYQEKSGRTIPVAILTPRA
ncbi:MAG TPA: nitroreductase/quinone reductase family protein [Pseudonocardiaceae bacterium]|nr:nitroreductase/quinone reductase family protein [Pseudonocardiaceae bacterium]